MAEAVDDYAVAAARGSLALALEPPLGRLVNAHGRIPDDVNAATALKPDSALSRSR